MSNLIKPRCRNFMCEKPARKGQAFCTNRCGNDHAEMAVSSEVWCGICGEWLDDISQGFHEEDQEHTLDEGRTT